MRSSAELLYASSMSSTTSADSSHLTACSAPSRMTAATFSNSLMY